MNSAKATVMSFLVAIIAVSPLQSSEEKYNQQQQKKPVSDFLVRPFFDTSVSSNITTQLGGHAYMPCRVKQLGNKSVSWIRRRDSHILTIDWLLFIADDRFRIFLVEPTCTWTLQIKYVQPRDAGIYECQINTSPKMSHLVQLNVVVPMIEIMGESDIHVMEGSSVSLNAEDRDHGRVGHTRDGGQLGEPKVRDPAERPGPGLHILVPEQQAGAGLREGRQGDQQRADERRHDGGHVDHQQGGHARLGQLHVSAVQLGLGQRVPARVERRTPGRHTAGTQFRHADTHPAAGTAVGRARAQLQPLDEGRAADVRVRRRPDRPDAVLGDRLNGPRRRNSTREKINKQIKKRAAEDVAADRLALTNETRGFCVIFVQRASISSNRNPNGSAAVEPTVKTRTTLLLLRDEDSLARRSFFSGFFGFPSRAVFFFFFLFFTRIFPCDVR